MRKTKILDSIISPSRQRILAATVLQPEREWYVSDLASRFGVPPSSLHRDLHRLLEGGVLRRRRDGNRVYISADPECSIMPELRQILVKTAGLVDLLRELLFPFASQTDCAFVYGSVARSSEGSASDVDIIVIGRIGLSDVAAALTSAREKLSREVNVKVYRPAEFAKKVRSGNSFLEKVLRREKLFVLGSNDALEKIVGGETGGSGAGNEAGG